MAQKTDAQLTTEANIIRDETAIGANTALRIGIMLDNLIDSKTNNDIISDAPLGTSTSIVPTQNAVKTYADGLVTGLLDDRGSFDASTGGSPYPTLNGSGAGSVIQKGDLYFISVAGTVGTTPVAVGASVRALVDTPAQTPTNWDILDAGVGYIPEDTANKSDATNLGGVSPSHTLFPTQYAVKSYVDGTFNPVIGWTTENVANKIQDLTIAPTSAVQYPSSAAVTTYAEPATNKSNDDTLGGVTPSATLFPTQNAVKTYVDSNGGGGSVNTVKVSLTSADILALNATPFTLIAAQGAGTLINVLKVWYKYNFITIAYTGGGSIAVNLGTIPVPITSALSNLLNSGSTLLGRPAMSASVFTLISGFENTPILLNASAAQFLGDGTLDVYLTYDVITL